MAMLPSQSRAQFAPDNLLNANDIRKLNILSVTTYKIPRTGAEDGNTTGRTLTISRKKEGQYIFNPSGQLIKKSYFTENGFTESHFILYEYNSKGKAVKVSSHFPIRVSQQSVDTLSQSTTYKYREDGSMACAVYRISSSPTSKDSIDFIRGDEDYNTGSEFFQVTKGKAEKKSRTEISRSKTTKSSRTYSNGKLVDQRIESFDEEGRPKSLAHSPGELSTVNLLETFEYNDEGKLQWINYEYDKNLPGDDKFLQSREIIYENGKPVEVRTTLKDQSISSSIFQYEYYPED